VITLTQLMANPLFSVYSLTAAINRLPYQPAVISDMDLYTPRPLFTTVALIERQFNTLSLVPDQPRGAPGVANVAETRDIVSMLVPHFPLVDTIAADSLLGIRTFGSDNTLQGVNDAVSARIAAMDRKHDITLEWLRLGGVKGVIVTAVNRDTGAPLRQMDLFHTFNVDPNPVQQWPIVWATPPKADDAWASPIRSLVFQMMTSIALELGGQTFTDLCAICGLDFFNAIAVAPEVRSTFVNTPAAAQLRTTLFGMSIPYAGCEFIPYMGGVGNMAFVPPDTAYFFPRGVPDLFVEAYAPADYMETVNTLALPRYAKQELMEFDKGVMVETQQNVLPICTRPKVLWTVQAVPHVASALEAPPPPPPPANRDHRQRAAA